MDTRIPVIAIFDIGKTNKKLLVFDQQYQLIRETSVRFDEIPDEDGFPCEDLKSLSGWVLEQFRELCNDPDLLIRAVNFSTYGASLVYLNTAGKVLTPLYNYLKPYPSELQEAFLEKRGDRHSFSEQTSTPIMGSLNAGLQLYRVKRERPDIFEQTETILHFPQYLSYLFTGHRIAELTHIGCHSAMWDFSKMNYHKWLAEEGFIGKLAPMHSGHQGFSIDIPGIEQPVFVGTGLHDSSAAIIPYLRSFNDPFVILSTGTWTISLNPFNQTLPDMNSLSKGGLNYLSSHGLPVRTSMLFAGNDHDQQVQRIAGHFNLSPDFYKGVLPDLKLVGQLRKKDEGITIGSELLASATTPSCFHRRDPGTFGTADVAYHRLLMDITDQQQLATRMVLQESPVEQLFVDGGFCRNELYMELLRTAFPELSVYAASMKQGTALGTALAIHDQWNPNPVPDSLIELKAYMATGKS
ncbi:FGGY-family carbohydrate kinase [Niabella terrae]